MFCSGTWDLLKLTEEMSTDLLPGQYGSSHDLLSVSLTTSPFSFSLKLCWAGWFWLSRLGWTETLKFFVGRLFFQISASWGHLPFNNFSSSGTVLFKIPIYPYLFRLMDTPQDPNTWERGWNVLKYFCFLKILILWWFYSFVNKKVFLQKEKNKAYHFLWQWVWRRTVFLAFFNDAFYYLPIYLFLNLFLLGRHVKCYQANSSNCLH